MNLRHAIAGMLATCLFGSTGAASPSAEEVNSPMPVPGRADVALAAARAAREKEGAEAEAAALLAAYKQASDSDESMDEVALRLAEFASSRASLREDLLKQSGTGRLVRLARKTGETRNAWAQRMFADEYLRRPSKDADEPEMVVCAARAHMLTDADETKALELWDLAAVRFQGKSESTQARIYAEAVRGPQSVAAIEAAHDIGWHQSQVIADPFRAFFSHWRVLDAAGKPFFKEFLASRDVAPGDKAELLYMLIFHAHQAGEYPRIPGYAGQIFSAIGYDKPLSRKAAYAVAVSYVMQGKYDEATESLLGFIRAYPNAEQVPKATLLLAQSFDSGKKRPEALVWFGVVVRQYPGTPEAKEALNSYNSLMKRDVAGEWLVQVRQSETTLIARAREPLPPRKVYAAVPLPVMAPPAALAAANDSASSSPVVAAVSSRLMRKSALIATSKQ